MITGLTPPFPLLTGGLGRAIGLLTGGLGREIFVHGLAIGTFAEDGVLETGTFVGGILAGGFDRVSLVAMVTVVVLDTSQAVVDVIEVTDVTIEGEEEVA